MSRMIYKIGISLVICILMCACGQAEKDGISEISLDKAAEDHNSISTEGSEQVVTYEQISQDRAKELMTSEEGYIILDVRTQAEFDEGHIPGAICVPNESIRDEMPAELTDLKQLILVYCRSGNRSKQASQKLAEIGYTNVKEFGGIMSWDGEIE